MILLDSLADEPQNDWVYTITQKEKAEILTWTKILKTFPKCLLKKKSCICKEDKLAKLLYCCPKFSFVSRQWLKVTHSLSFSESLSVMVSLMEEREPLWITGYRRGIWRKHEIIKTRCAVYPRATATLPSSFTARQKGVMSQA